jgi:hypothetical protein
MIIWCHDCLLYHRTFLEDPSSAKESRVSTNNVTEFIFTGLFQDSEVQRVCFVLFLCVYLA